MLRIALCDDEEKHVNQAAVMLNAYLSSRPDLNGQVDFSERQRSADTGGGLRKL